MQVTGAPFTKCRGQICSLRSVEVLSSTHWNDVSVLSVQLEIDYTLFECFGSQTAGVDVDLACFWIQACAAVGRGTLAVELFEVSVHLPV